VKYLYFEVINYVLVFDLSEHIPFEHTPTHPLSITYARCQRWVGR
jgi:hypothetical protein